MTAQDEFEEWLRTVIPAAIPVSEVSDEEIARLCAMQDAGNRVVARAAEWLDAYRATASDSDAYVAARVALAYAVDEWRALGTLSAPQTVPASRLATEPGSTPQRSHSGQGEANRGDTAPITNPNYRGDSDD